MTPNALAEEFQRIYGRAPNGIWAAPGRVNLIGEHTDYTGGLVLPFALERRTSVALALRNDREVHARSSPDLPPVSARLEDIGPGGLSGWGALPLGVAWALGQNGVEVPGFDLLVGSDLASGAGLSSSAALSCAVALGMAELTGAIDVNDRHAVARVARRAENEIAGVPTGAMDQLASLYGVAGHALLLDCRTLQISPVPLTLEPHGLAMLVIDTRVTRELVGTEFGQRRANCDRAVELLGVPSLREVTTEDLAAAPGRLDGRVLRRARHVVTENARVEAVVKLLAEDRLAEIGAVLAASHASLRDDHEVSCAELDVAVEAAEAAGALGARMVGGGFGGSALALVRREDVEQVRSSLISAFAGRGWARPRTFDVLPADGARRLA